MAASTNGSLVKDYHALLDGFERSDAERVTLVRELVDHLEKSEDDRRKISYDLDSERNERRRLQQLVDQLGEDLKSFKARRSFVLVLIDADGDDYTFQERFLKKGEEGGKDAVDEIVARIKDYLKSSSIYADDMDIMVRAYANLKGLAQACFQSGKLKHAADLGFFAVGFTKRQALFDFVDVGVGKERADYKIRETLSFYIDNAQCKHVILGCSHDGGYAPFLEKFAADDDTRERITLLKSGPIHPQIAALGFTRTLTLKTVFGSQNIKKPVTAPSPFVAATSTVRPQVISSDASSSSLPKPQGSRPMYSNPAIDASRLGPVIRNNDGLRIDKPLNIDPSSPYFLVLRKANLCPWYYLRGACTGCGKNHLVPPLSPYEYDCLWYQARNGLCNRAQKGKDCDDPKCVYGHGRQ